MLGPNGVGKSTIFNLITGLIKPGSGKIKIAEERMLSTKDMLATKGRASFLGERAKGHIDPGARSSQLIIDTICKSVINN